MKPFTFIQAQTVAEAGEQLARHGTDAMVIAGGQSLLPLLRTRTIQPGCLIDISRIDGLRGTSDGNGSGVRIGPATTYRQLSRAEVPASAPHALVVHCAASLTDPQVRSLATVGGAACFAAPAYDMPPALTAVDAYFTLAGPDGTEHRLSAADFFLGSRDAGQEAAPRAEPDGGRPGAVGGQRTAVAPDELLLSIGVPALPAPGRTGWAVERFAVHQGFAAVAWVGAVVTLAADASCERLRLVVGAVEAGPVVADTSPVAGQPLTHAAIEELAHAVARDLRPVNDPLWGSPDYKRELVTALTRRAVGTAAKRAAQQTQSEPAPQEV